MNPPSYDQYMTSAVTMTAGGGPGAIRAHEIISKTSSLAVRPARVTERAPCCSMFPSKHRVTISASDDAGSPTVLVAEIRVHGISEFNVTLTTTEGQPVATMVKQEAAKPAQVTWGGEYLGTIQVPNNLECCPSCNPDIHVVTGPTGDGIAYAVDTSSCHYCCTCTGLVCALPSLTISGFLCVIPAAFCMDKKYHVKQLPSGHFVGNVTRKPFMSNARDDKEGSYQTARGLVIGFSPQMDYSQRRLSLLTALYDMAYHLSAAGE